MKRIVIVSLSILLLISLFFLKSETIIGLEKLPYNYTAEDAIRNGDVYADNSGKVYNLNKLTKFMSNIRDLEKDKIRITICSIEGDPIIYYLDYDGKNLVLTVDTTRDKFGTQDMIKYNLKSIKREVTNGIVSYYIVSKDGKRGAEILIYKDIKAN
jgi:hypothetical protein